MHNFFILLGFQAKSFNEKFKFYFPISQIYSFFICNFILNWVPSTCRKYMCKKLMLFIEFWNPLQIFLTVRKRERLWNSNKLQLKALAITLAYMCTLKSLNDWWRALDFALELFVFALQCLVKRLTEVLWMSLKTTNCEWWLMLNTVKGWEKLMFTTENYEIWIFLGILLIM